MTVVESSTTQPLNSEPHAASAGKPSRKRQADAGQDWLPEMQHFVSLARKAKRPGLLRVLIERCHGLAVPELASVFADADGSLSVAYRRRLFQTVAALPESTRITLERAAERVLLLGDEYGVQAVQSLLHQNCPEEARWLEPLIDKHSRALYLYLRQEYPESGAKTERRFDQAEWLQTIHRQWTSERYASHYQGPKGIVPKVDATVEEAFKDRIVALYPQSSREDILIEHFTRRDLAHDDRCEGKDSDDVAPMVLHTVTVTFNGAELHYTKVVAGEEIDCDDLAALSIVYSFEPATGALSVFSEDEELRPELAAIFRDVALASDGAIGDLPIRRFDLSAFATPAMLHRLAEERIAGIDSIAILELTVAKPFEQRALVEANDREIVQHLASQLRVTRDRRDTRNVYTVAYEDYALEDLSVFKLTQVKLVIRMARQPHRRAHNVTLPIKAPNGFPRHRMTVEDYKRIMAQLVRLGIAYEF
jgi:hypothetical protein